MPGWQETCSPSAWRPRGKQPLGPRIKRPTDFAKNFPNSAWNPHEYWLGGTDCDSCCRGFEPHQPPHINTEELAIKLVAGYFSLVFM
jgi:hypothetical protein